MFVDETGCMLGPLVRRTLARARHTPILRQDARGRRKVSVISALTLSPARREPNLYFQLLPDDYYNGERVAQFLRRLLSQIRGKIDLIWDNGMMHRGKAIRTLSRQHGQRLTLHRLPPNAPDGQDTADYLRSLRGLE